MEKRKVKIWNNIEIEVKINPELDKYDNDPIFQENLGKKMEIAKKKLGNPQDLLDAFKRIQEEEQAKAKKRKTKKSIKAKKSI